MFGRTTAFATILVLAAAGSRAAAQEPQPKPAAVDVAKLPISTARLQRKLTEAAAVEQVTRASIFFNVTVVALAPRVKLVTPEDNLRGQPRFSPPVHQDMIRIVTPLPWKR